MEAFASGEIQVLVSTTVVEVGVNVPNATVMMVENAERFGLAQLHQLRGRVGRGEFQSYCIFIQGNNEEDTSKRLKILNESNDGFYIAGEDLKLRGPGDLFGIRQSGLMEFKIGDIYNDAGILKNASEAAGEILALDFDLRLPQHKALKERLMGYMSEDLENLGQLVQRGFPQKPAHPGDILLRVFQQVRGYIRGGRDLHGPEFPEVEGRLMDTHPFLAKEKRAGVVDVHGQHQNQEKRRQ